MKNENIEYQTIFRYTKKCENKIVYNNQQTYGNEHKNCLEKISTGAACRHPIYFYVVLFTTVI